MSLPGSGRSQLTAWGQERINHLNHRVTVIAGAMAIPEEEYRYNSSVEGPSNVIRPKCWLSVSVPEAAQLWDVEGIPVAVIAVAGNAPAVLAFDSPMPRASPASP